MSEGFKELTVAYQQATKRIDTVEKSHQEDVGRIKMLEKRNEVIGTKYAELEKRNGILEKKVETLEKRNEQLELENKMSYLVQSLDRCYGTMNQVQHRVDRIDDDLRSCKSDLSDMNKQLHRYHYEALL